MELLTKNEYAFRSIRDDIITGELPGGKKLTINDLANSYGVSHMPIRSALSRLEELGYVRTEAHVGTWVCEFELEGYFTNMLMRIDAEALAAHMVALQHSNNLIQQLRVQIEKMREAKAASDFELYGRLNRQFHTLINTSCNNQTLVAAIDRLVQRTNVSTNIFSWLPQTMEDSLREHELIVDAIEASNGPKCTAIITYQRCRSNLALLNYMRGNPAEEISVDLLRKSLLKENAHQHLDMFITLFSERHAVVKSRFD